LFVPVLERVICKGRRSIEWSMDPR